MAIPTLLLPLDGTLEGRGRSGMFTATGAGALRWVETGETVGRTVEPLMLIKPEGSRDRNGAITPEIVGTVNMTSGRYGDAWAFTGGSNYVRLQNRYRGRRGTVIVRFRATNPSAHASVLYWPYASGSSAGLLFGISRYYWHTHIMLLPDPNPDVSLGVSDTGSVLGTHEVMAARWSPEQTFLMVNGRHTKTGPGADFAPGYYALNLGYFSGGTEVESVLIYDEELTDEEIARISNLPKTWTWENARAVANVRLQAVMLEEGTTNGIRNPLFNPTGFHWIEGRCEYKRDLSVTKDGEPSARLTVTDKSASFEYIRGIADGTPGQPYTISAFARGGKPGMTARLLVQFDTATFYDVIVPNIANDDWTEVKLTIPSWPEGFTNTAIYLETWANTSALGDVMWWTQPQSEPKPYRTSFCPQLDRDGNLLPGYSWTGTEHASPSTRDSVSIELEYPHAFGEAVVRYSEDDGETWQTESIHEPGAFGTYGTLDLSDGVLTIGVTSHAVLIDQLFVFDRPLTEPERTLLMNADPWEWQMLYPRLGGVLRVDGGGAPFSVLRSGYGEG